MADSKHGAQLVQVTSDHKYELNEDELSKILMREDTKDLPVAVVSVAGVYRAGKSFLLNFFLRYLTAPESSRADGSWVGDGSSPLTGFSWISGSTAHTTGILMWSEPIVTTLPNGQKVAILLIDTQGTFDTSSTFRDCSVIFALSILLSSVQIYNLKFNINENDLQYLQFFTDYGRSANEQSGKPFQVLEFLIRDWEYPYEHAYGETGGAELLADKLRVDQNQPKELREVREHIGTIFEKVSCFLMPHPGFKVLRPTYKGEMNDISIEFRDLMKDLVHSLFSPEKLLLKKINGEVVKSRDLFTYFKTYMKIFNSDKLPPASTILQATTEAGLLTATSAARHVYEHGMDQECGPNTPSVPATILKGLHQKYIQEARTNFISRKKMGSAELADQYLRNLLEELEHRLPQYLKVNLSKIQEAVNKAEKAYEDSIISVHGSRPLCVHPKDLEQIHHDAVEAAMKEFDATRARGSYTKDDERSAFLSSFEKKLRSLRLQNERNNITESTRIRLMYFKRMQGKCFVDPPLGSEKFKQEHEIALADALEEFGKSRNLPNTYTEDVYKFNMVQDIMDSFVGLKQMNQSKNKIAIQAAINLYDEHMSLFRPREQCLHPEVLQEEHERAKCRALRSFQPGRLCEEAFNSNDADVEMLSNNLDIQYREQVRINEIANQEAVEYAYAVFQSYIEERVKFSWWWLLIIPLIKTAFEVPQYIADAQQAARTAFQTKRRPGGSKATDQYLQTLESMMKKVLEPDT